jgi:hypothetical protein
MRRIKLKESGNMNLDIMKMGYIILFKTDNSYFARKIQREQLKRGLKPSQSVWTHAGISGGGQWLVEVSPPKSRVVDIRKRHRGRYIKVLCLKDTEYKERKRYKIAFWAASLCNLKYDWFGILKFRLKWLFHFKSRFFCSENTLWSIQKEYPGAFGMKPHKAMPGHFDNPNYTKVIWEGKVS